ncbi:hypothetical protein ACFWDI_27005 [Streptomyces sp. NPDC060064]|uniref:hypothetical protein n=1 Tax=Streptomyces sp. NPDC060064 TaxID=3347049 RepID=UPI00369A9EC9
MSATAPVGSAEPCRSGTELDRPTPFRPGLIDIAGAPALRAMFSEQDLVDGHGDDSP